MSDPLPPFLTTTRMSRFLKEDPAISGQEQRDLRDLLNTLAAGGENFIFVSADGTPTENGQALLDARDEAAAATPNGNPKSATNPVWLVMAPGIYDLGSNFLDLSGTAQYVGLAGMGNRSARVEATVSGTSAATVRTHNIPRLYNLVIVNKANQNLIHTSYPEEFFYNNIPTALRIGTNNPTFSSQAIIKDVDLWAYPYQCISFGGSTSAPTVTGGRFEGVRGFSVNGDTPNSLFVWENMVGGVFLHCVGGSYSFGHTGEAGGTYIDCAAGDSSFGRDGTASGTFDNCTAGNSSFGSYGTASGTFKDCTAGNSSFGRGSDTSGTFKDCTAGLFSFGSYGTASGDFKDCIAGHSSFGSYGAASGTFNNCTAGGGSFGSYGNKANGEGATGTFVRCKAGAESFGYDALLTGVLQDCETEDGGFCGGSGENTGRIERSYVLMDSGDTTATIDKCLYHQCRVRIATGSGPTSSNWPGWLENCIIDGEYGDLASANEPNDRVYAGGTNLFVRTYPATGVSSSIKYGHTTGWGMKHPSHFPEVPGYY